LSNFPGGEVAIHSPGAVTVFCGGIYAANGGALTGTITYEICDTDTEPPVIILNGVNPQIVEFGTSYVENGATAIDDIDGDISDDIVISGTVNTGVLGDYFISYDVSDSAGNPAEGVTRTVSVIDTQAPVITLLGDNSITLEAGSVYSDAGAEAQDNHDGDISADIVVTGAVDTDTIGTYVLSYDVSDSSNNPAQTVTREVHIVDTTAPVISGLVDITTLATSAAGATVSYAPTANDAVDGPVPVICTPSSPHLFAITTTTVSCSATDSHGNTATGTFTVKVHLTFGNGFKQPVDNGNVYNKVKGGATVPLKFNIYGTSEITDKSIIHSLKYKALGCDTQFPVDDIETTATGGTSLSYTGGNFQYNWKTPSSPGCYQLTIYINDGSAGGAPTTLVALFQLK
jgi:hypothetical protein